MKRFLSLAVMAAMILGSFAAFAAEPRSATQSYIAVGDFFIECTSARDVQDQHVDPVRIGGTCFRVDPALDATASVKISDDRFAEVGGYYSWQDAEGNAVGDFAFFCNEAADLAVPAGASVLFVGVQQAFSSTFIGCGNRSAATTGSVTAIFTPPAV